MVKKGRSRKKKGTSDWGGPKRHEWTAEDERELKSFSRKRAPIRTIMRSMKRTAGAVRQKAYSLGISLGTGGGAKSKKKSKRK
jgi:hypothetical protein